MDEVNSTSMEQPSPLSLQPIEERMPAQTHVEAEPEEKPFSFTGSGGEYFRIWIVNLCLTLLTLGIYSAWAKVRTEKYFYGHTFVDGSNFDYLASPITILKGRLIAFALLAIYLLVGSFFPFIQPFLILPIFLFLPFLLIRALNFRARNSSYRNIRFSFDARIGEAYLVFVFLPILIPFTLGLIYPYMSYRQTRFIAENYQYGTSAFNFDASNGDYYKIFLKALGLFMLSLILVIGIGAALGYLTGAFQSGGLTSPEVLKGPMFFFGMGAFYLLMGCVVAYVMVSLANLLYNSIDIEAHCFNSEQRTRKMLWIQISNIIALVCTVGLFYPWALVRLAKYRAETLTLYANGSLDNFVAAQNESTNAFGEEIGDAFDLGFGV